MAIFRHTVVFFLFAFLVIFTFSCGKKPQYGPFFGNGFHNGWADQHSVVIWTRLTRNPELNSNGIRFLVPTSEEHRQLDRESDPEKIWKAQIPEGATLDDMDGACPGAPGEVRLVYYPLSQQDKVTETDWQAVDVDRNFTTQWKLTGLLPGSQYVVRLEARAQANSKVSDRIEGAFKTPPAEEVVQDISFCVVTCHDYWRRDTTTGHKIYDVMMNMLPDFFVHTGDIEYYDKPEPYALTEELMRFKWDRIFALPLQRRFYKQTTTYFMKDDHDALTDDAFPGMTYGTMGWERGLEIFDKEQFPSNELPYKTIRWGKDLQIWLMEGRNFRSKNSDPDGPGKSIWGTEQKEWLFRTMEQSDATFKVLISPAPILGPDRDNKKDNYSNSNWKHEGDEIRAFLNRFDNVFICNGDRHWQYVTHFEGTNLWEFSTGAGADKHAEGWNPADCRPEHRFLRVKGGFLGASVSRLGDSARLVFSHYDVNGTIVHTEEFVR